MRTAWRGTMFCPDGAPHRQCSRLFAPRDNHEVSDHRLIAHCWPVRYYQHWDKPIQTSIQRNPE